MSTLGARRPMPGGCGPVSVRRFEMYTKLAQRSALDGSKYHYGERRPTDLLHPRIVFLPKCPYSDLIVQCTSLVRPRHQFCRVARVKRF